MDTTKHTQKHWDKHDLYELCVQNPEACIPLINAIHGRSPRTLAEDFAGTANLSRQWADQTDDHRAIATDLDQDALNKHPDHPRVTKVCADVNHATDPADVIFVGNFSIGYHHTRAELVAYLKQARARLAQTNGTFLCDTYGGENAFIPGGVHRPTPMGDGRLCRYTWEQRDADPLTGMVRNYIHFRIEHAGTITDEMDEAFEYHWRLWSVPELRDAMLEAGFNSTNIYAKLPDAIDDEGNAYINPIQDPQEELEESFIVLVAGTVCD
jgi:hypothetical protein